MTSFVPFPSLLKKKDLIILQCWIRQLIEFLILVTSFSLNHFSHRIWQILDNNNIDEPILFDQNCRESLIKGMQRFPFFFFFAFFVFSWRENRLLQLFYKENLQQNRFSISLGNVKIMLSIKMKFQCEKCFILDDDAFNNYLYYNSTWICICGCKNIVKLFYLICGV